MSDLADRARNSLSEGDYIDARVAALVALADAVEAVVEAIKAQPVERTVQLEPVLGGPVVGDPLGYIAVDAEGRILLDNLEPEPFNPSSFFDEPARVGIVYALPTMVEEIRS